MRGITNAKPKDGVQTINNVAPDADNDFTIEAGTGVTITSGTNKITIDAAGGGDWTKRTANNDWSDLFDVVNNVITAKKDIVMQGTYDNSGNARVYWDFYIPKGLTASYSLNLPVSGSRYSSKIFIARCISISTTSIASSTSTIDLFLDTYNFTTDGSTVTVTASSIAPSIPKDRFNIYTKD